MLSWATVPSAAGGELARRAQGRAGGLPRRPHGGEVGCEVAGELGCERVEDRRVAALGVQPPDASRLATVRRASVSVNEYGPSVYMGTP